MHLVTAVACKCRTIWQKNATEFITCVRYLSLLLFSRPSAGWRRYLQFSTPFTLWRCWFLPLFPSSSCSGSCAMLLIHVALTLTVDDDVLYFVYLTLQCKVTAGRLAVCCLPDPCPKHHASRSVVTYCDVRYVTRAEVDNWIRVERF